MEDMVAPENPDPGLLGSVSPSSAGTNAQLLTQQNLTRPSQARSSSHVLCCSSPPEVPHVYFLSFSDGGKHHQVEEINYVRTMST